MNVAYINPFLSAAREVLEKMAHMGVAFGKPFIKGRADAPAVVRASISLSGAVTGSITFSFDQKIALALASGLTGTPLPHIDADCLDALGELASMICGGAKKDLPATGLTTISTPSISLGKAQAGAPHPSPVLVIPCDTDQGPFTIQVALDNAAASAAPSHAAG